MFPTLANAAKISPLLIPSMSVSAATEVTKNPVLKPVVHRYHTEWIHVNENPCMTPAVSQTDSSAWSFETEDAPLTVSLPEPVSVYTGPLKAVVHRYRTEFVPIDQVTCLTPTLRSATPLAILSPLSNV